MKKLLPIFLFGFGLALALIIGERMSTDAMAVVIGVSVGIAASVPTSLLLVALLRRERQSYRPDPHPPVESRAYPLSLSSPQQQPNVIIIDPAQYVAQRYQAGYPLPPTENSNSNSYSAGGVRRMHVVGSDEEL